MRRPILFITAAYVAGIVIQHLYQMNITILWIAIMLSFILCKKNLKISLISIIILSASLYFYMFTQYQTDLEGFENEEVSIEGLVLSVSEVSPSFNRIVFKAEKLYIDEKTIEVNEKILMNINGENNQFHDWVGYRASVSGYVYKPPTNRNPGTFNYQMYLKTKNIHMMMDTHAENMMLKKSYNRMYFLISHIKNSFSEQLFKFMNKDRAGIVLGLLFGDKDHIDDAMCDRFQKNGTAHILAVSGIHIGILYSVLEFFFRKDKNAIRDILVILILCFYAAISNFSPSVIRAVMMIISYIISKWVNRRYDLLSSAGFVAFVLLLYNPYMILNVGFQLSFMAVFSIGVIYPFIDKKIKTENTIINIIKMIITIQIGTAPLIAYHFNYFSLIAFVINIPIVLLAEIMLPVGFILVIFNFMNEKLFFWLAKFEEVIANALIYFNEVAADIPYSAWHVASPSVLMIILYYLTVYLIVYEKLPQIIMNQRKNIILATLGVTFLCWLVYPYTYNKYEVVFVDVGQGDCIHIKTPKGKHLLIDGGGSPDGKDYNVGEKVLLPYLLKNGANKIDLAIISHLHADHYKGIMSIMDDIHIERVAFFKGSKEKNVLKEIEAVCLKENSIITYIEKNDRINIEKDISISVLYPELDWTDDEENNNSLVLLLEYQDNRLLLTGDIEKKAEAIIERKGEIKADVLKVPHHGSSTSSTPSFIQSVNPRVAIIQVGKNTFGHPDSGVLRRYKDEQIKVFRTDEEGAILLDIKEGQIIIETVNGDRYGL